MNYYIGYKPQRNYRIPIWDAFTPLGKAVAPVLLLFTLGAFLAVVSILINIIT